LGKLRDGKEWGCGRGTACELPRFGRGHVGETKRRKMDEGGDEYKKTGKNSASTYGQKRGKGSRTKGELQAQKEEQQRSRLLK